MEGSKKQSRNKKLSKYLDIIFSRKTFKKEGTKDASKNKSKDSKQDR